MKLKHSINLIVRYNYQMLIKYTLAFTKYSTSLSCRIILTIYLLSITDFPYVI